jgi:amino acid transporter
MEATTPDPRRDERAHDEVTHHDTRHTEPVRGDGVTHARVYDEEAARDRFGGANIGAAFFGWLVAVGMTALLTGIAAVIATAVGYSNNVTQTDAERSAGTVTLVTAIVLLAILLIAYYSGGYVAGRMSRFDGARQGVMVWVIGLLVTLLAVALGWIAGDQYNLLDRVDVPRIPIPSDDVTLGGILTAVAVLVGTLLAAMFGGTVGRRYHTRVDRAAAEPIV